MRTALIALCLTPALSSVAMAQDDSPLFGSVGSGVIQITMADQKAETVIPASSFRDANLICTDLTCPTLQKTAMRGVDSATQP